jgi:hypothetical protein
LTLYEVSFCLRVAPAHSLTLHISDVQRQMQSLRESVATSRSTVGRTLVGDGIDDGAESDKVNSKRAHCAGTKGAAVRDEAMTSDSSYPDDASSASFHSSHQVASLHRSYQSYDSRLSSKHASSQQFQSQFSPAADARTGFFGQALHSNTGQEVSFSATPLMPPHSHNGSQFTDITGRKMDVLTRAHTSRRSPPATASPSPPSSSAPLTLPRSHTGSHFTVIPGRKVDVLTHAHTYCRSPLALPDRPPESLLEEAESQEFPCHLSFPQIPRRKAASAPEHPVPPTSSNSNPAPGAGHAVPPPDAVGEVNPHGSGHVRQVRQFPYFSTSTFPSRRNACERVCVGIA